MKRKLKEALVDNQLIDLVCHNGASFSKKVRECLLDNKYLLKKHVKANDEYVDVLKQAFLKDQKISEEEFNRDSEMQEMFYDELSSNDTYQFEFLEKEVIVPYKVFTRSDLAYCKDFNVSAMFKLDDIMLVDKENKKIKPTAK